MKAYGDSAVAVGFTMALQFGLVSMGAALRGTQDRGADFGRVLLHADLAELIDNEFFASWQRTAAELWERYSDSELAVILDFLGDTAERLRTRTEALAVGGRRGAGREEHRQDAGRRGD